METKRGKYENGNFSKFFEIVAKKYYSLKVLTLLVRTIFYLNFLGFDFEKPREELETLYVTVTL